MIRVVGNTVSKHEDSLIIYIKLNSNKDNANAESRKDWQ